MRGKKGRRKTPCRLDDSGPLVLLCLFRSLSPCEEKGRRRTTSVERGVFCFPQWSLKEKEEEEKDEMERSPRRLGPSRAKEDRKKKKKKGKREKERFSVASMLRRNADAPGDFFLLSAETTECQSASREEIFSFLSLCFFREKEGFLEWDR